MLLFLCCLLFLVDGLLFSYFFSVACGVGFRFRSGGVTARGRQVPGRYGLCDYGRWLLQPGESLQVSRVSAERKRGRKWGDDRGGRGRSGEGRERREGCEERK